MPPYYPGYTTLPPCICPPVHPWVYHTLHAAGGVHAAGRLRAGQQGPGLSP